MLDQVIAHSSHILKSYPNSIEALRFLGQAYLEEKKFSEVSQFPLKDFCPMFLTILLPMSELVQSKKKIGTLTLQYFIWK